MGVSPCKQERYAASIILPDKITLLSMNHKQLENLIMMKMPGELFFSKEGKWFHDETYVSHEKIAAYFSKNLTYSKQHSSWVVEVDGKCVPAKVEDTPQVATNLELSSKAIKANLSNLEKIIVDCSNLQVSKTNVWYLLDSNYGKIRLLRNASLQLWPYLEQIDEEFILNIFNKQFTINAT